jgi:hypothetical protein
MQRSGIRERASRTPDSIAFNPGYDVSPQNSIWIAKQKVFLKQN